MGNELVYFRFLRKYGYKRIGSSWCLKRLKCLRLKVLGLLLEVTAWAGNTKRQTKNYVNGSMHVYWSGMWRMGYLKLCG